MGVVAPGLRGLVAGEAVVFLVGAVVGYLFSFLWRFVWGLGR